MTSDATGAFGGSAATHGAPCGRRALVTLYTKPGCHLCEDALVVLRRLQGELPFELRERDITADERLHRAYFERIPVVCVNGEELCELFVDERLFRERLSAAS